MNDICASFLSGRHYVGLKETREPVESKGFRQPQESDFCPSKLKGSRSTFQQPQYFRTPGISLSMQQSPFCCSICGKQYRTREGLRLHIHAHQGRKFSCPICDNKFTQKGSLKTHMKSIHKALECPTCHKVFPQGPVYEHHLGLCF